MQFIQGSDRHQTYFTTFDEQVAVDNPVRLVDAFIDKLELEKVGFGNTLPKSEGRPAFAPSVLLKLYLYGYLQQGPQQPQAGKRVWPQHRIAMAAAGTATQLSHHRRLS